MKKLFVIIFTICTIMLLPGCNSFDLDAETLLEPPSLTDEQEKLNSALADVIGDDYSLKYPSNGSYSSAFMFYDIDSDDKDEALAFYSIDDESTRMNILRENEDGSWQSIYEAAGSSGGVDTVQFLNLGDGDDSIVVKWDSEVGVYSFVNNRLDTKYMMSCDGIITGDISGDGYDDIIMFGGSYVGRANVRILYFNGQILTETDSTYMTAMYDKIYNFTFGDPGTGTKALFIDSNTYENIYLTEIITLENGDTVRSTIADYMPSEEEQVEETEYHSISITTSYGKRGIYARNTKASCMDVDGDGITEFPVEYRDDTATEDNDKLYFIQYMKYDGEKAVSAWSGYVNADSGFMLALPEEWLENVNIEKNKSSGEFVFTKIYGGNEILRIRTVSENEYQDIFDDSYILLMEQRHKKYYAVITAQKTDSFYIDPDTLSEGFRLI